MACLNCDHTMQKAGDNGGRSVFWCPRCGTLKMEGAVPEFESPTNNHLADALRAMVREFDLAHMESPFTAQVVAWHQACAALAPLKD